MMRWFKIRLFLAVSLSLIGEVDARNVVVRRIGAVTPPPPVCASGVAYLTSGSSWTPPTGFCPTDNQVEVVGGGGTGSTGQVSVSNSTGGGGGAYAIQINAALTVGVPAAYNVGVGGTASATRNTAGQGGGDTYICLTTANCSSIADSGVVAGAKGGSGGNLGLSNTTGGAGGLASASIGTTKFNGGNGGPDSNVNFLFNMNHGGGGGAACSLGVGGNGGGTSNAAGGRGGAGGGGGCGYFGISPRYLSPPNWAGAGGYGRLGGARGLAGINAATPTSGTTGTKGAGGGGGGGNGGTNCANGGDGALGADMDPSHGAGGGGGAAGIAASGTTPCNGGNGGLYGGGGGGANYYGTPGNGAAGIIKITWPKPIAPPPSTYAGFLDPSYSCLQTFWVAPPPLGKNTNTGLTSTSPFAQIGWAINNKASAGTCVRVLPGTYTADNSTNTNVIVNGGNQDSLTGYIVMVCDTPLTCFLNTTSALNDTIDITKTPNPVDFIIIDGFDISNDLRVGCSQNSSCNANAIDPKYGHHIKIINNEIHNASASGVQTAFMDYLLLYHNNIRNNAAFGASAYSGISMVGPQAADLAPGAHYYLGRNYFAYNAMGQYIQFSHTDGNGIIFDNWISQGTYNPLTIVENNILTHQGTRGIELLCAGGGFTGPANFLVRNNTAYENATDPRRSGTTGELFSGGCLTTGSVSNSFYNNIAVANPAFAQNGLVEYCLEVLGSAGLTFNNNLIWNGATSTSASCIQGLTVTDGVNGNILGHAPLIAAPTVNSAVANWHLQITSPAVNAGIVAGGGVSDSAVDFYGNPRVVGGQIDMGAAQGGYVVGATWAQAGSTLDLNFANALSGTDVFTNDLTVARTDTHPTSPTSNQDIVTDILPSSPYYYQGTGYSANTPRVAYSGTNTAGLGLLIEPATTNYYPQPFFFQSVNVNNGDPLPAGDYTLWVIGTNQLGGFATLSGCASGTANVGGAQVHFTLAAPAVCTVTISWTGGGGGATDLTAIQLQNGSTASSYILTPGSYFTATGSGTSLTVTNPCTGCVIAIGSVLNGSGVPANTRVVSQTSSAEPGGLLGGRGVYVTSNSTTSVAAKIISLGLPRSRTADFITLKGTALSTAIGSAASLFVNANGSPNAGNVYILQGDGYTLLQSTTSTTMSGLTPTLAATFGSLTRAGETKAATAFDGTGRSIVVNNGTVATDGNVPASNTAVAVGNTQAGAGNEYYGSMADIALWASRLSNTTLQGLTTIP